MEEDKNSWRNQWESSLEPTTNFVNRAVVRADNSDSCLLFIHTHPSRFHPSTQSPIDAKTDRELFTNTSEILQDRPFASLILSRVGLTGVVLDKQLDRRGKEKVVQENISEFRIIGTTISVQENNGSRANLQPGRKSIRDKKRDSYAGSLDRQIKAIGIAAQARLNSMRVAVIGVGGIGSAVAVQLGRMGLGKITLVDRDIIDESNLSRVYGSTSKDIGKPKVAVLKKHIESFSKSKVEAIQADVGTTRLDDELADSDVIFGCTDNLTSRSVLNDLSLKFYIPLIDGGCRISLRDDGSIEQIVGRVQVVNPDGACLWCNGTLNATAILQESYSSEEKRKLAAEGYYQDLGRQPSIISLTTLVASLAVSKFIAMLGVAGESHDSRTTIELKDWIMLSDTPKITEGCICARRRGLGAQLASAPVA